MDRDSWRDEAGGEIKCEKAEPNVADFEDGRRRARGREYRWHLEA